MINRTLALGIGGAVAITVASLVAYNHGTSITEDRIMRDWAEEKNERLGAEIAYKEELNRIILSLREENTKLSETVRVEYVDKVRTITNTQYKNRDVIREVFVGSPYMNKGWVYAHDQLSKNEDIDPIKAADNELSDYTWEQGLQVIAVNYSIAEQARGKDESWNEFYEGVATNFSSSSLSAQSNNESRDRATSTSSDGVEGASTGATAN